LTQEILTSIPFVFFVSVVVVLLIFWFGGRIAAKGKESAGKLTVYACGEDVPAVKLQVNVERFLLYAVFFLIFDALAFLVALSYAAISPLYPIAFTIIILLSVGAWDSLR